MPVPGAESRRPPSTGPDGAFVTLASRQRDISTAGRCRGAPELAEHLAAHSTSGVSEANVVIGLPKRQARRIGWVIHKASLSAGHGCR
jgi:hypothetical protein